MTRALSHVLGPVDWERRLIKEGLGARRCSRCKGRGHVLVEGPRHTVAVSRGVPPETDMLARFRRAGVKPCPQCKGGGFC